MLESLFVALREGIEIALVVSLTLSYLERTGRHALRRSVWGGFLAALVASLGLAALIQTLSLEDAAVEGVLMVVAAIFTTSMMIWMQRAARRLGGEIRQRVDLAATSGTGGAWSLALFVFVMVVREGAETVVFLSALSLTTTGMKSLAGALLGFAVAAAFGLALYKGTFKLDLKRFFLAATIVLAFLVVELLLHAYVEFGEIGWVPWNEESMEWMEELIEHGVLFVLGLLAFPVVYLWGRGARAVKQQDGAAAG